MIALLVVTWVFTYIFLSGYWTTAGHSIWWHQLIIFTTVPLLLIATLAFLTYEIGNKLYYWGD